MNYRDLKNYIEEAERNYGWGTGCGAYDDCEIVFKNSGTFKTLPDVAEPMAPVRSVSIVIGPNGKAMIILSDQEA